MTISLPVTTSDNVPSPPAHRIACGRASNSSIYRLACPSESVFTISMLKLPKFKIGAQYCSNYITIVNCTTSLLYCTYSLHSQDANTNRFGSGLSIGNWIQDQNYFAEWLMGWLTFITINHRFGTIVSHQLIYPATQLHQSPEKFSNKIEFICI